VRHYLDHASTSPLRPEARTALAAFLDETGLGDPGRVHAEGRAARDALERARSVIAAFLGAAPREVVLTSGGTEAVATAVSGAARRAPGRPVLCAAVEHASVRLTARRVAPVLEIPVDALGRLDIGALEGLLSAHEPALVCCQWANHEVGTLQPVRETVALCRSRGIPVLVDAAAGAGGEPIRFDELGADLLAVSAHKIGGPPGAGALVVRRGLRLEPLLVGGEQERGRRAGFENLLGAVGFAAVAEALAAPGRLEEEARRAREATARILDAALSVPGVRAFGDTERRVAHIVCVGVDDVEAEAVLLGLDRRGVAVHSGAACASEALEPSPVLAAMGAPAERSLRCSVGWSTTPEDVEAFARALPEAVAELRDLRRAG
jgi:cysteine desulfurase